MVKEVCDPVTQTGIIEITVRQHLTTKVSVPGEMPHQNGADPPRGKKRRAGDLGRVRWLVSIIPTHGRPIQEECSEFQSNVGYRGRLCKNGGGGLIAT